MLPPQSGRVPHGLAAWRVALTGKMEKFLGEVD